MVRPSAFEGKLDHLGGLKIDPQGEHNWLLDWEVAPGAPRLRPWISSIGLAADPAGAT